MIDSKFIVRLIVACLLVTGMILAIGCSDDDPVTPLPDPLTGPDLLVDHWRSALAESDSTLYASLFADDFKYLISPDVVEMLDLPTTWFNAAEMIMSGHAMFSGQPVENAYVRDSEGIESIFFISFEKENDWTQTVVIDPFPNSERARYRMHVVVTGVPGAASFTFDHILDFYAAVDPLTQEYQLVGMAESPANVPTVAGKVDLPTWGGAVASYLDPEAPSAALSAIDRELFPVAQLACNATGSADAVHGLHTEPYRFSSTGAESWSSEWLSTPQYERWLETPGLLSVRLEVRNRWLEVTTSEQDITVEVADPPQATTPSQLMDNFEACHDEMLADALESLLDADFRMPLLPSTIAEWALPPGFAFNQLFMAGIHQNLFNGGAGADADGNLVPPIDRVVVRVFEQQADWVPIDSLDPLFGGHDGVRTQYWVEMDYMSDTSHTFRVSMFVIFYAESETTGDATDYKLLGIVEVDSSAKSENLNWGDLLSMFVLAP